jgi:hypothetical protein
LERHPSAGQAYPQPAGAEVQPREWVQISAAQLIDRENSILPHPHDGAVTQVKPGRRIRARAHLAMFWHCLAVYRHVIAGCLAIPLVHQADQGMQGGTA